MPRAITLKSSVRQDDDLHFHRLTGTEELGRMFEFRLELFSEKKDYDPEKLLGNSLTVEAEFKDNKKRYFNGYVTEFRKLPREGDYVWYEVVLRPWIWFLTRTSDCVIFQDKTVPEILKEVFDSNSISASDFKTNLSEQYEKRNYCVQYCESDFNFVSRLMEQEGIYYYFEHDSNKHVMVLIDNENAHKSIEGESKIPFREPDPLHGFGREHIFEWSFAQDVRSGSYVLDEFDFEKPKAELLARNQHKMKHPYSDYEVFEYPGAYTETKVGNKFAKARREALHSTHYSIHGKGDATGLAAGGQFELIEYPLKSHNREYLIVSATHDLTLSVETAATSDAGPDYSCHFQAIPSKQTFRSRQLAVKPVMRGPQTAIVVGKSGEEIWTDKYGRVKVQFHWDREGKRDENSSCWIRVAHAWAGNAWGSVHIPRIGNEVVVEFLDGNPDRPIITGMVYNADVKVPYEMPANQTQSGLKTRSTKNGDGKTFNELRFEDKKGEEEIYFHAERDFTRVVENDDSLKVGFDTKDKGNQTIEIFNDRDVTVEKGKDKLQLKTGDREVTLDKGTDNLTIKQGDQKITINLGKSTTKATKAIELKVGTSSITMSPTEIKIKAMTVKIEGGVVAETKAPVNTFKGTAMANISGGMVKIN